MRFFRLNPITRKRLQRFRRIKRGFYSFVILASAAFVSLFSDYLANPHTIDILIEVLLGFVLLWLAFGTRKDTGKRPEEDTRQFTVLSAFGFGAVVNFVGIPFAVPYFAALDQILKADLSTTQALVTLVGYNLAYMSVFLVVPLLCVFMGEKAKPLLAKINNFLDKIRNHMAHG